MVNKQLVCAPIITWGAIACVVPENTSVKIPQSSIVSSICISVEKPTTSDEIIIQQNTVGTISNHRVAASNIFERELPDDKGVIALRMSANLSIWDIASQQTRHEKVFAGKVITLAADRYCVVQVKYGESSSGSVTLRKIP